MKSLQYLTVEEDLAVHSAVVNASPTRLLADGTAKTLHNISLRAKELGLTPEDLLCSFAENTPTMSAEGLYYKSQYYMLRYIGPIGCLLITALGIATVLRLLKQGASKVLSAIRSAGTLLTSVAPTAFLGAAAAPVKWLWQKLFGTAQDAVNDGVEPDADAIAMILSASLPLPLNIAVNMIGKGLDGTAITTASSAAPATSSLAYGPPAPATGGGPSP